MPSLIVTFYNKFICYPCDVFTFFEGKQKERMWGKEELGWWARRHGGRGKFSQNAIYEKIMKI